MSNKSPQQPSPTAECTLAYEHNFARVTSLDERRAELTYDLDHARWPWLSLPPQHPVLIEKYQYFSALTAAWAMRMFEPTTYTALTRFDWDCHEIGGRPELASRGVCIYYSSDPDTAGFEVQLLTTGGQTLVNLRGAGYAFTDRDFGAWRQQSRSRALAASESLMITYAPPGAVGLGPEGRSFVSPLRHVDGQPLSIALVRTESGFHPVHPFHTGSADHVNAGHLFDCVLQMANLTLDGAPRRRCTGGAAEFFRFIELDVPFEVRVVDQQISQDAEEVLCFALSQLDRDSARITLRLR